MDEVSGSRVVHQSERFKVASEQQSLASQKLIQANAAIVKRLSSGSFASSKELQAFLDGELVGLLGSVSEFMEKTNALRSAWEDGLVLLTDALESQAKVNEELQKQIDLLRIEKSLKSLEPE